MKENKNIERLFQERFKDFEVQLPENAWKNIESKLQKKKKKRRIIPFWIKPTGIAAGLAIFFGIVYNQNTTDKSSFNTINKNGTINYKNNTKLTEKEDPEKNVDFKENLSITNDKIVKDNNFITKKNTNVVNTNGTSQNKFDNNNTIKTKNKYYQNKSINNNSHSLTERLKESEKINSYLNQNKSFNDKNLLTDNIKDSFKNLDTNNHNFEDKTNLLPFLEGIEIEKINADINSVIHKEIQELVVLKEKEDNILEKLLKEKEAGKNADEKEKEVKGRWAVSTNAAPIYFNSFTSGSPLDNQFASNDKSYETSISVGLGASYQLSEKIKISSGLNKLNLSYNTNDIYYINALNENISRINSLHVNRNNIASNVVFYNKPENIFGDVENFSQSEKGILNQQFSFVEVPLELHYSIINKKVQLSVASGLSTFILQENAVSLLANGMQMPIGKANNLNDISFSANFGLGVSYDFWKKFSAQIQPTFKYQVNTFSNSSGNFTPYIIGLYTGINYKF